MALIHSTSLCTRLIMGLPLLAFGFMASPTADAGKIKSPQHSDRSTQAGSDTSCAPLLRAADAPPKADRRAWQGMTVILDTNVLLINPRALFDFPGARVVIHNQVLRELDKKKKDRSENRTVAPNARRAARVIEQLQAGQVGDPDTNILQLKQSGGLIVFDTNDYVTKLPPATTQGVLDPQDPDDRIIATALYYDMQNRERKGEVFNESFSRKVVFISQDVQAKTKTRVKGVTSDEYEAAGGAVSREEVNDEIYSGTTQIKIGANEYHEVAQKKLISRLDLHRLLRLGMNSDLQFYPNQYVIFVRPEDEAQMQAVGGNHKPLGTAALSKNQLLGSYNAETDSVEILPFTDQLHTVIQPRNLEQRMLVHALMTPRIRQVTVLGKAGTGKTLLTLMAGKEQTDPNRKSQNKEFFKQMILMRTLDKVGGEEIGFLPGELEDKVGPAMQSYHDNLEVLLSLEKGRGQNGDSSSSSKQGNGEGNGGDKGAVERFLRSGQVQIQVMGFVRGRSIQNRFLVIDEAQNLDPGNMKTILTRPGEGTKLVVMGDIGQIDSPFLNLYNNGVTDLVNRIRSLWDKAKEDGVLLQAKRLHQTAVVRLEQGERSELAEFMTELYETDGPSK